MGETVEIDECPDILKLFNENKVVRVHREIVACNYDDITITLDNGTTLTFNNETFKARIIGFN